MALDRQDRLVVNKLAAILRVVNALDAEHLQKVRDLRLVRRERAWMLEIDGDGDLTMEQLAATARADLFAETFGHELVIRPRGCPVVIAHSSRPEHFINRELSWLAFNERVLEEAADPTNALLERVKFAAIVASNLDEFFMVRVARSAMTVSDGEVAPDPAGLSPSQQLAAISQRTHAQVQALYDVVRAELTPELAAAGVSFVAWSELNPAQRVQLGTFFREDVLPVLTPLAVDSSRPFPLLSSLSINLVLRLEGTGETPQPLRPRADPGRPGASRQIAEPAAFVPLEEIVRAHLGELFPGQRSSSPPSSGCRATRSSSWTTRAAGRSWRSSSASCAAGGAAASRAWKSRRARPRSCWRTC